MKIHVLASPHNPTGTDNRIDAFAFHAYKYIKHLSNHFDMIHYGIEGARVDCTHVNVSNVNNFSAGEEIAKRKSPGDIIVCFFGVDNKLACDMNNDCKIVEPSIGYRANGVFAPYRVFTSYANMHYFYGERGMLMNPSWFDAVIGNPFTVSEFEYCDEKDDYYLYLGRVIEEKGIHLAIQATERLNKELIIAGPAKDLTHLGYNSVPNHVELVGHVNPEQRNQLLKKAKALFGLTYYVEPFGNMIIEANLCGTPVITTDWGAFSEIVVDGVTGFRIRDFNSLLAAMQNINQISAIACRNWGLNFSDEAIHEKHRQYLLKVIKNNFYE